MDYFVLLINGVIITKVQAIDKWKAINMVTRLSDDPCFFNCIVFGDDDMDYEDIPEYTSDGVRYIEYDTIKLMMEEYKLLESLSECYSEKKAKYDVLSSFIKDYETLSLITEDVCHMAKVAMDKIYKALHE